MFLISFATGIISTGLYYTTDKEKSRDIQESKDLLLNIEPKYVKMFVIITMVSLFSQVVLQKKVNTEPSIKNVSLVTTAGNTKPQCPF
jgi:hypothetical protein